MASLGRRPSDRPGGRHEITFDRDSSRRNPRPQRLGSEFELTKPSLLRRRRCGSCVRSSGSSGEGIHVYGSSLGGGWSAFRRGRFWGGLYLEGALEKGSLVGVLAR